MSRVSIIKILLCCLLILINGCIPALSSESLAESDHPYANNFEYTWTISEPGADQICLHFEYLKLAGLYSDAKGSDIDKLILLDKNDNVLKTYKDFNGFNKQNFCTEWYAGDTLKVKLVTDSSGTANGFKIDRVDIRRVDEKESNILTSTELISSDNSYASGQSVTLTAKVNIPSTEIEEPSGTVTFMDGTTIIATEDVNSGRATLTTSSLSSGSHSITAEYSGDSNFKSSTSAPFTLTVQEQSSIEEPPSHEKSSNNEESSNPKEQNNIEEPASNEEMSSTKQNSPITDFIVALASGFILLVVGSIVQNKKNKK